MKIKRVLNNNAAISENKAGVEVLLLGAGLAFGKKVGQVVDMEKVDRTFLLKDSENMNKFTEIAITASMPEIVVVERVINFAKIKLDKKLNESIYVNLTDHLHSTLERIDNGVILTNPLKWDIARLYPNEYAVGKKALEIIHKHLGKDLSDDEAAFIAQHFINAEIESENNKSESYEIIKIVSEVEEIVKDYFHTEFDVESLNYYRFITHLKFFAQRILEKSTMKMKMMRLSVR
jgi:beta-glucoside operon transcriptional antiterminator